MNVNLLSNPRHFFVVLATAAILAIAASSASVWIDGLTGASFTPAAYACQPQGDMCG